jgi:hypothetical protein
MKDYGKVQKMAGCGCLADWSTATTRSAISSQTTRQPDMKHFPDATKKQEKADKAEVPRSKAISNCSCDIGQNIFNAR